MKNYFEGKYEFETSNNGENQFEKLNGWEISRYDFEMTVEFHCVYAIYIINIIIKTFQMERWNGIEFTHKHFPYKLENGKNVRNMWDLIILLFILSWSIQICEALGL